MRTAIESTPACVISTGNLLLVDWTINILKKIAKTNKKEVPDEVYESVKRLCEEQKKKKYKSIHKSTNHIQSYSIIYF